MRFAVTGRDETIDALAMRVYRFDGEPPAPVLAAARDALTGANPFLEQGAGVPAGTVLAVPPVEDAEFGAQTQAADATAISAVGRQLYGAVALTRQSLAQQLRDQEEDARQSVAALSGAKGAPAGLRDAATARAEAAKALEGYAKEAFGEIESDLAELTRAFS
jgi:hypothetical protein